jgi:lipopolysaccharide transport system ATP-binding protein
VGDAAFQKKCLGKMEDVAKGGRTVLFVSHNMGAVKQLCQQSIIIDSGKIFYIGENESAIRLYLNNSNNHFVPTINTINNMNRTGTGGGKIIRVELLTNNGTQNNTIGIGESLTITFLISLEKEISSIVAGIEVKSNMGIPILNLRTDSQGSSFGPYKKDSLVLFTFKIPSMPFYPGIYKIEPWFAENKGKRIDHVHDAVTIKLEPIGNFRSERLIQFGKGIIMMDFESFAKTI